jgi:hypothetical protein
MNTNLQYPIGKFIPMPYSDTQKATWLAEMKFAPERLEHALQGLDAVQLETPYRPNGWTIQQLVHHIADSHTNGFIRTKLTLTEDKPIIKPYEQDDWVLLPDSKLPYNLATTMLHVLHKKWCNLFENLTEQQFNRTYIHPADKEEVTLWHQFGLYAWHGNHHITQIENCVKANNW